MEPCTGTSRTALGKIWPKAATTATSARYSARRSGQPASRSRGGCSTGTEAASARCFTGEGVTVRPRPAGLSGWVMTATTWWRVSRASSVGRAKAGVP